jgi:hypothetical protein
MVPFGCSRLVPPVLGAFLLLCACESPQTAPSQPNDGVSSTQFEDIPVPDGLRLRERMHKSDSIVVGDYRYGNFVYTGSVPAAEVASYMRERMPQHAWQLVAEDEDAKGNQTLSFRRGKYTADCSLGRTEDKATQMTVKVRTELDEDKK